MLSDIMYSTAQTTDGSIELFLDIYQPTAECDANRPTVLFVHGGGFTSGNKVGSNVQRMADVMTSRGINFVSIQYRLQGDNPVPSPAFAEVRDDLVDAAIDGGNDPRIDAIASAFEDTVSALNFLESNEDTYCVDTDRIGYWGSSAGAFTVLQVAYGLNQFGIERPEPKVVVDFWGNLLRDSDLEVGEAPFFVIHGTNDPTVAFQDAVDLTNRAQLVAVPFAFYSIEGGGHGFGNTGTFTSTVEGTTLIDLTADFVEAHLTGATPLYRSVNVTPPGN